jgi:hypothetical protein
MRRHFALISRIVREPLSSIQISAAVSRVPAWERRVKSRVGTYLERNTEKSTPASEDRSRSTSARVVISSEKIATFFACSIAALRAMLSARAVFPMLGRAARITSSPFWSPPVISSKSLKPVGMPVSAPPRLMMAST